MAAYPYSASLFRRLLLSSVLLLLGSAVVVAQDAPVTAMEWYQRARLADHHHGDSTEYFLNRAWDAVRRQNNPRLEADILAGLADVYSESGRFEQNFRVSQRAIELYKQAGAGDEIAHLTLHLGYSFRKMGDVNDDKNLKNRGLEFAAEGIRLATAERDTVNMMEGYNLTGIIHRDLRQWPAARDAYEAGLRLARESGIRNRIVGELNANLGQWYMDSEENYPRLIAQVKEAQEIYNEIGDSAGIEYAYRNMGHAYMHMRQFDEAIRYGEMSVSMALDIGDPYRLYNAYEELSEAQEESGDYESALHSYQTARRYERSTLSEKEARTVSELDARYQNRQNELIITAREAELEKARRTQQLALVGILLLGLAVFFARREARNRRHANEELTRRNADIEAQRAEIEEKNRQNEALMHEIHHRVKNNLQVISSLLNLQSHHLEEGAALDAIRAGQSRVKSIALLHQSLYRTGHPAAIELQSYVNLLLKSIGSTFGLEGGNVKLRNLIQPRELDVERAVSLGLIINELVTNALKYAFPDGRSGTVTVSLYEVAGGRLRLRVADDGVGIDAVASQESGTRFGTKLVKILLGKLRGDLRTHCIDGTVVELEFAPGKDVSAAFMK